jgi:hypothetical protein
VVNFDGVDVVSSHDHPHDFRHVEETLGVLIGMRTQPCEAGYPGSGPAWSAMPDQVMRCMKGMEASSYRLE